MALREETFAQLTFCHFDRRENSCKLLINHKIVTSLRSSNDNDVQSCKGFYMIMLFGRWIFSLFGMIERNFSIMPIDRNKAGA